MSYLDIAFLALVVLFALVGLWKGFFKSLIGMFGWIVALLIAFFCAKPLAEWLAGGALKGFVSGTDGFSLYKFISGKLPAELMALPAGATAEQITAALGGGVFAAFMKPFMGLFTSGSFAESAATVGEGMALVLSNALFTLICGVALFIVARIVMSLFCHFAKSAIDSSRTLTAANRFLGFILGAARGALYACLLLFCASFLTGFGFMSGYNKELDKSTICKPVSEYVAQLPEKILNDDNWFTDLLEQAGLTDKSDEPTDTPDAENPDTPDAENPETPDVENPGTDEPLTPDENPEQGGETSTDEPTV